MANRGLVVDANILVRAVLGKRVRGVIEAYAEGVSFFVPEVAYSEAEEHLAMLVVKRSGDPEKALSFMRSLRPLVVLIGSEVYGEFEAEARKRLGTRDPEDWPILASALALRCPIWTEDGFFRLRCGHLDVRPRPNVSAGLTGMARVRSADPVFGSAVCQSVGRFVHRSAVL